MDSKKYKFRDIFIKSCEYSNGKGNCTKSREAEECTNGVCVKVNPPAENKKDILIDHYNQISHYDSDISNDSDDYDISNIYKSNDSESDDNESDSESDDNEYDSESDDNESDSESDDNESDSESDDNESDSESDSESDDNESDKKFNQSGAGDKYTVDVSNFDEVVLNSKVPVFVDFYADWCGHCQSLIPIWQRLCETIDENKVKIVKYEATKELPNGITIDGFPTIILFKNGEKIHYNGERSFEEFNKFLDLNANANQYGGDRERSRKYIVDGEEISIKGKSIPKKKEEITLTLLHNYNRMHQCKDKYCKYYRKVIKNETESEHNQRHLDRIEKYGHEMFPPIPITKSRRITMTRTTPKKYVFESFPGCKGDCNQKGGCGPMCLLPLLLLGAGNIKPIVKSKSSAKLRLIKIVKSTNPSKKLMAVFEKNGKQKTTHFGSFGMSDYTIHKDPARKKRYLNRHRKNENWNDPTSAGSLSRYIFWGKTSLRESIADYKRRFHFN